MAASKSYLRFPQTQGLNLGEQLIGLLVVGQEHGLDVVVGVLLRPLRQQVGHQAVRRLGQGREELAIILFHI
jgi:hypothetical protein